MLDAVVLFGFFGIVPAIESANEITGDTAKAFEFAFIEVIGVFVEVLSGSGLAFFLGDKLGANFYEAGNVHSFVLIKTFESFESFFLGNFGVTAKGRDEAFDVEIFGVILIFVNDFFHGFSCLELL